MNFEFNTITIVIIIFVIASIVLAYKVYEDTQEYCDIFMIRVLITLVVCCLGLISIFLYLIFREIFKTAKKYNE